MLLPHPVLLNLGRVECSLQQPVGEGAVVSTQVVHLCEGAVLWLVVGALNEPQFLALDAVKGLELSDLVVLDCDVLQVGSAEFVEGVESD